MSDSDWKALESWDVTRSQDEEGDTAQRFGLAVDFYFRDGFSLEKRREVLECFREYDGLCGQLLRWWVVENQSLRPVSKLKNRDMAPYMLSPKWETPEADDELWSFIWHGGDREDDASPVRIEGMGETRLQVQRQDEQLSYLRASFPVTFWADKVDDLLRLVLRWSARLRPVHGYGGVTLIRAVADGLAQLYENQEYGFAMRYPGIEIDSPMSTASTTLEGIKGGNWITLLGDEYVAKLGDAPKLRAQLGSEFRVEEYPGGAMIVTGTAPEIGDRNRNIDTPRLSKLARVLKPIRTPRHWPVQARGKFSDADTFNAWLARFDD